MSGFSAKLPLSFDSDDGFYTMNKTIEDTVRQNLKMLLLTCPGERIMDPIFGVGVRNFLFNQNSEISKIDIKNKIYEQVSKYLPFLELTEVSISGQEEKINIKIVYKILPISAEDILSLNFDKKINQF